MDTSDWMKGIVFSVLASFIGAASKLAIRKGWLMEEDELHVEVANTWNGLDSNSRLHRQALHDSHQQQQHQEAGIPPAEFMGDNDQENKDKEEFSVGNRARGRSVYTAVVELDQPYAGSSNSLAQSIELDMVESTPTLAHSIWRSSCCSMARLLRYSGMFGMTFVNPAFGLLAMNYASPSITAPFSGLTLVWVIVFSRPLLGEVPSLAQQVASFLIVMGEVMVAVFGDHSNVDAADKASVEASYREGPFIAYFVCLGIWMLLITLWIRSDTTSPTLRRFAWGTSGGAITGFAQCFVKDSLVVAKTPGLFHHMPLYLPLFLLLAAVSTFGGLLLLTATMKRYDCTYSAAMFVGSFVVSTSIMSAAHYHTFAHLNALVDLIMYPLGLLILMVGLAILVQGSASIAQDGGDSDDVIVTQLEHYLDVPGEDEEPVMILIENGSAQDASKLTSVGNSEAADDLELVRKSYDGCSGINQRIQRLTAGYPHSTTKDNMIAVKRYATYGCFHERSLEERSQDYVLFPN